MLRRLAPLPLILACLFAACSDDASYPVKFEDSKYDLEKMTLIEADVPVGLIQQQAQTFDNEQWAEIVGEDDPEAKKNQLDAQGRLLSAAKVFSWDNPIEHLGHSYQITSQSTLFVSEDAAKTSLKSVCDLPIDPKNPSTEFRLPKLGDQAIGLTISEELPNFGTSKDTVICFRTGRIIHAIVESGLDGTQDIGRTAGLASHAEPCRCGAEAVVPSQAAARDEIAKLALSVATEAANYIRSQASKRRELIATKSTPTDMVTEVDRTSEAMIIGSILAARPDDAILGEEGGGRHGTSGVRWIIDPLDGTTNFIYGIPAYAVSIAAEVDGTVEVGVVIDVPHAETYFAEAGGGATVNGERLSVSGERELARALITTGFGYDPVARAHQAAVLAGVVPRVRDVRRAGSAALDLCSVARGRMDGMYEFLAPWDYAAGALIVQEAGGHVFTNATGGGTTMVIAANPHVFDGLRALVAEFEPAAG